MRVQLTEGHRQLSVVRVDNAGTAKFPIGSLPPGPHTINAIEWGTGTVVAEPLRFTVSPRTTAGLAPLATYSTGFHATLVTSGDLYGHGSPDLIVGDPDGVSFLRPRNGLPAIPRLRWTAGSAPTAIALNDFNGDGLNDLAITCADGRVAIFLNTGSGRFSAVRFYKTGELPSAIVSADFNGDGIPDLAIADQGSNDISILRGNGDGSFQPAAVVDTGYSPRALIAGDFNNDGHTDLATANYATNDVSILFGDGVGGFPNQSTVATGNGPVSLAAADFDEDGSIDLAVLNQLDGTVSILLNNQFAVLHQAQTIAGASSPISGMLAADVNGDGHIDLLLHTGEEFQVRPGAGDGTFLEGFSTRTASTPLLAAFVDLDQDGIPDIALIDATGEITILSTADPKSRGDSDVIGSSPAQRLNTDRVLLQRGRLPLAATPSSIVLSTSATPVAFGQFVALTATLNPTSATGKVTFFDGVTPIGTRTISNGQSSLSTNMLPSGVRSVKAVYSGNDTYQVSTSNTVLETVTDQSNGGFQAAVKYGTLSTPYGIAVADLNNDGKADLVIASAGQFPNYTGSVSVYLGNGDGSFRTPTAYATAVGSNFVVVADTNGDGFPDLIVANWSGSVSVLAGRGDGTFLPAANYGVGNSPYALALGDFNGDGNIDIAVANNGDNTVSLLIGNAAGTFSGGGTIPAGTSPQSIVAADFNSDGFADLAVAGTNGITLLLGNGNASFRSAVKYTAGANPYSIASGDFNGDGRPDLAVANLDGGNVSILIGNGDGTFRSAVNYAAGSNSEFVVIGDFNGDGAADLAVANFGPTASEGAGNVSVLYGNGNGAFSNRSIYNAGSTPLFLAVGNLNGDGSSDLVISDVTYNQLDVLLGTPRSTGPVVTIDAPLNNASVVGTITVSGWALDVATPINKVQVAVDGTIIGNATYGISRQDICNAYPGRPNCPNIGFSYALNTSGLRNGYHTITVTATDTSSIPASGSASIALLVTIAGSISGQVTASGVGLSGVAVNMNGSQTLSTTTDASGNYSFTVAVGGTYTVAPARVGYSFSPPVSFANLSGNQTASFIGAAAAGQQFYPLTPCRIADTRLGAGFSGAFGPPSLAPGATRTFPVTSSNCGVPPNATAYALNVTVVPQGPLGLLTVWPAGQSMPNTSTLSSPTGTVVANAAIVPAGAGGAMNVFANGTTDAVIDVNGYFAPPSSTGLQFYPVTPCRVADTRNGAGFTGAFGPPSLAAGDTRTFAVPASNCGIPSTAAAYALHFTVVPPGPLGLLTIWPAGKSMPNASTLNSYTGTVVSNQAIVPAGSNGAISAYVNSPTDLLFDITGYFAPPLPSGMNFYPVSPCRIADTRVAAGFGGAFGPPSMITGVVRSFQIPSSACEIPSTAQAYSFNFTVVPPGPLGFITTWPTATSMPNASTLNSYNGTVVASAALVPAGAGGAISVYANGPTDLLFDVNGYFSQ